MCALTILDAWIRAFPTMFIDSGADNIDIVVCKN